MALTPEPAPGSLFASPEDAAARLEERAPGYLDAVRRRTAELAVPPTAGGRARRSIGLVADTSKINPDAPQAARRWSARLVKRVVGRATRFYVVHLTDQLAEFGESTSWMGSALCDYIDSLEAEVADLRERVGRLEAASGPS
jgi:hypothetical protein